MNKTMSEFCNSCGITQTFSAAQTPGQNGVVERRNQTLVEAARSMLAHYDLPQVLRAEVISTTCYTQNRSIIHRRFDKTLYELINNRKPNVKYFRIFGCKYFVMNQREDRGRIDSKDD